MSRAGGNEDREPDVSLIASPTSRVVHPTSKRAAVTGTGAL